MKSRVRFSCVAGVLLIAVGVHAKVVNFTVSDPATEARLLVASNEVAEILAPQSTLVHNNNGTVLGRIDLEAGGLLYQLHPKIGENILVAGPAAIKLTRNVPQPVFVTVRIGHESFPPDKTLIIPEGTGALVRFQCSTNLLDWTDVWSGGYTNVPSNKFFRICADRTP